MLGRWQPWHDGHQALFKKALEKTGQVCIMVRDVGGVDAGVPGQNDNPFVFEDVKERITTALKEAGYNDSQFEIVLVPNIVDISYGRGVGYTFTEHNLGEQIHNISATKIRKEMREMGQLTGLIPPERLKKALYMDDTAEEKEQLFDETNLPIG